MKNITTQSVITGDCRTVLPTLKSNSFSLVISDPPYPSVPKSYGVWNEEEWFDLMNAVVPEVRRVLKPGGSAVFILKPNSEKAGRMRLWLWEFIATWGRKWGLVQDCVAWNYAQLPFGACTTRGLLRGSVSYCVWLGDPDCYRDQDAVLWAESDQSAYRKAIARAAAGRGKPHKTEFNSPSRSRRNSLRARLNQTRVYEASEKRGGVTPFNLIPASNTASAPGEAGTGHPARTAPDVVRFWTRYACPPGGTILDPFAGSGTVGAVAAEEGRSCVGVEINEAYADAARSRLAKPAKRKPA